MVTIFSVPKNFERRFGIIQRNAITSWTKLSPRPEIILFGNDEGTAEICRELSLKHIPQIERNEYNTPLLSDVFLKAQRYAKYDTLLFIMADIILLTNPIPVIEKIKKSYPKFLLVGQRYEIKVQELIDFADKKWQEKLTEDYILKSKMKGPSWMDYFIFSKNLYADLPPFAIGRTFWDKWLVWKAITDKIPVIDCTHAIIAAHQNHDYSHAVHDKYGVWEGPEARENIRLAGGWTHGLNIKDTTFMFKSKIIFNKKSKQNLKSVFLYYIKLFSEKYNRLDPFVLWIRKLINRV